MEEEISYDMEGDRPVCTNSRVGVPTGGNRNVYPEATSFPRKEELLEHLLGQFECAASMSCLLLAGRIEDLYRQLVSSHMSTINSQELNIQRL